MEQPKFDRYVSRAARREFVAHFCATIALVGIRRSIRASRDPADDKFLDVAVNGKADALVTGDADLLTLHAFEGIPIISPAGSLAKTGL